MPRYSGVVFSFALLTICLGINATQYPAVKAMLVNEGSHIVASSDQFGDDSVAQVDPAPVQPTPSQLVRTQTRGSLQKQERAKTASNLSAGYGPIPANPQSKYGSKSLAVHQIEPDPIENDPTEHLYTLSDFDENEDVIEAKPTLTRSEPQPLYGNQKVSATQEIDNAQNLNGSVISDQFDEETELSPYEMVEAFRDSPLDLDRPVSKYADDSLDLILFDY